MLSDKNYTFAKNINMKIILHILLIVSVFSAMAGCQQKKVSYLDELEEIVTTNPDSAYTLLESDREEAKKYTRTDKMRYGLLRLKCQNVLDLPFDSQDSIKIIVDYYSANGSYNEKLLSTYLLGRSYMEKGDDPMAMECFNKCLALKTTSEKDVDYIQLSKVHSQLYEIFRNQKLHKLGLDELNAAKQCATLGEDSLLALVYDDLKAQPYYNIGMLDSAINVSITVTDKYLSIGNKKRAAESIYMAFISYIKKKEYSKAKYYMDIFERESGAFDSFGNIEPGREIFYYMKGQIYEGLGLLDSAEFQYRRLLAYKQDNNNIEAATKGLLSIYRKRGDRDSIGKYADWYCEANDSAHAQLVSEDVARLKAMYDYSEYKRKSEEMRVEAEKTKRNTMTAVAVAALVLCFLMYRIYLYRKRKQAETERLLEEYDRTLQIMEELNGDKEEMMRSHQAELESIRESLTAKGVEVTDDKNVVTINKELLRKFADCASGVNGKSRTISSEDWYNLFVEMSNTDAKFMLLLREANLSDAEKKIAVLIRLHFKDYQIKNLLESHGSSISNFKARINKKLFNQSSAKTLRRQVYAY